MNLDNKNILNILKKLLEKRYSETLEFNAYKSKSKMGKTNDLNFYILIDFFKFSCFGSTEPNSNLESLLH